MAENTFMPQANCVRTVARIDKAKLTWTWPSGYIGWMDFPEASQFIESRDGFLKFNLLPAPHNALYRAPNGDDFTVTLTKVGE
jgi:hypothetical protein